LTVWFEQSLKPTTGEIVAKSGPASTPGRAAGSRSAETRDALVAAAITSLRVDGFAGASARAIAGHAGVNQALVFYHFGSVVDLLLAALDDVSARRLARYTAAVDAVSSPSELVAVATRIFREDLDQGYVSVLVEMIAGAASSPELGEQVAARIAPWRTFAEHAIEKTLAGSPFASLVPVGDAAYAVVALYLGLEMLSHLDGDRTQALALFDQARTLVSLVAGMADPMTGDAE
jgi:AcrR family transcriptional regulator